MGVDVEFYSGSPGSRRWSEEYSGKYLGRKTDRDGRSQQPITTTADRYAPVRLEIGSLQRSSSSRNQSLKPLPGE